jgi:hypothetical protein
MTRRLWKRSCTRLSLCALTVGLAAVLPARPEEGTVGELEGLVAQWVGLRQQLAREKRGWDEQQSRLREEIRLLSAEKTALEQEISETDVTASEIEQGRVALLARREAMSRAVSDLAPLIERAEVDLGKWQARVPVSLGQTLREALERIPVSGTGADRTSLARRLQVVIAAYTEIENLQGGVHAVREVLSLPGRKARELDVLYLGLARGFAVGPDDDWAAVGRPGPDGWTWSPRPGLAPQVRAAMAVLGRRSPAAFVPLPLHVHEGHGEVAP